MSTTQKHTVLEQSTAQHRTVCFTCERKRWKRAWKATERRSAKYASRRMRCPSSGCLFLPTTAPDVPPTALPGPPLPLVATVAIAFASASFAALPPQGAKDAPPIPPPMPPPIPPLNGVAAAAVYVTAVPCTV